MSINTNPPIGASLLFGALSNSAVFSSGSDSDSNPRLKLKGVSHISWFTNRPDRVTGQWSPRKLVQQWDSLYGMTEPNAIASFRTDDGRRIVAFEMFEPRWNKRNRVLAFGLSPLDSIQNDVITGLNSIQIRDLSLFIDDSNNNQPSWYPNGSNLNLTGDNFSGMNLSNANMDNTNLNDVIFTNTNLSGADLFQASGSNISGQNANFSNAILWTAILESSDFTSANFASADAAESSFENSDLTSADFSGADLSQANLQGANLSGANLNGANIGGAQFFNATWGNTICPNGIMNNGSSPCANALPYG